MATRINLDDDDWDMIIDSLDHSIEHLVNPNEEIILRKKIMNKVYFPSDELTKEINKWDWSEEDEKSL